MCAGASLYPRTSELIMPCECQIGSLGKTKNLQRHRIELPRQEQESIHLAPSVPSHVRSVWIDEP